MRISGLALATLAAGCFEPLSSHGDIGDGSSTSFTTSTTGETGAGASDASGDGTQDTGSSGTGSSSETITSTGTTGTTGANDRPAWMFVTSTNHAPGSLGGLDGADAICQERADAGGLEGTYVAWLSTATTSAVSKLTGSGGWARPDGRLFVRSLDDLLGLAIVYPPHVDEFGLHSTGSARVVTSGGPGGTLLSGKGTCSDYTSTSDAETMVYGYPSYSNSRYTYWASSGRCDDDTFRLYCFEVGRVYIPDPLIVEGRHAFLSSATWDLTGGIDAADAICTAEAAAVGLPGAFRAVLADVGETASVRFDLTEEPWFRIDGAQLAPTASAFFGNAAIDAALITHADGSVSTGEYSAATGIDGSGMNEGTVESTCDGWQGDDSETYFTGAVGTVNIARLSDSMLTCDANRLYCLEE